MRPTPAARLHVILVREAPLSVVIRRGPAERVCTIPWNWRTYEFTLREAEVFTVAVRTVDLEGGA